MRSDVEFDRRGQRIGCAVWIIAALMLAAGCGAPTEPASTVDVDAAADIRETLPADAFLARIAQHCGQAFEGVVTANEPPRATPDALETERLVMHVRGCDDPTVQLQVPFHVGDNHSRTWLLTRTDTGLRLKHDHRLEDGSDDPTTMYGGDTVDAGTEVRQEFPADAESHAIFERRGTPASNHNVWAMEIEPGGMFLYEVFRPDGRLIRVVFDLATPVEPPPTPWGY